MRVAAAVNSGPPSEDSSSAMPNVANTRRRQEMRPSALITGSFHHWPIAVFCLQQGGSLCLCNRLQEHLREHLLVDSTLLDTHVHRMS